jgi:sugar O-acyltransferase (sialic acid O-acetyltransferase NeuD family)
LTAFAENTDSSRCAQELLGRPIIWVEFLHQLAATHVAVCAIGTNRRRRFIGEAEVMGFTFATVRHPTSTIFPTAHVSNGCIVSAAVVIGARTHVGPHVIFNRGVLVGHHTTIGSVVTLSPGANVGGRVTIGDGAYIGMGAVILNDLSVGAGSVVAAGSVVTRDVPAHVQVRGVPARIVKRDVDGL